MYFVNFDPTNMNDDSTLQADLLTEIEVLSFRKEMCYELNYLI